MKSGNYLVASAFALVVARSALADTVYNSIPSPPIYNLPSLGYEATSTSEFGDEVTLAGTSRQLTTVEVGLSNWALRSTYMTLGPGGWTANLGVTVPMDADGYTVPLTFNIYTAAAGPTVGALLATKTVNAVIPWRPENGPGGTYVAADFNTYNGIFTTANFDFSSLNVTLPNTVIYGLAFNTADYGSSPIGQSGPYNSLNFALATTAPDIGSQTNPGTVFWNTSFAGFYTDLGASGVGTFRQDTAWAPYVPAVEINAVAPVPLPASVGVGFAMLGGFGLMFAAQKKLARRPRIAG